MYLYKSTSHMTMAANAGVPYVKVSLLVSRLQGLVQGCLPFQIFRNFSGNVEQITALRKLSPYYKKIKILKIRLVMV